LVDINKQIIAHFMKIFQSLRKS